jgi:hypothetical protein
MVSLPNTKPRRAQRSDAQPAADTRHQQRATVLRCRTRSAARPQEPPQ